MTSELFAFGGDARLGGEYYPVHFIRALRGCPFDDSPTW